MLGWQPSEEEPTPYDFMPSERWSKKLSELLTVENVYKIMLRFRLKFRSTGVASQAAAGARLAAARGGAEGPQEEGGLDLVREGSEESGRDGVGTAHITRGGDPPPGAEAPPALEGSAGGNSHHQEEHRAEDRRRELARMLDDSQVEPFQDLEEEAF